MELGVRRDAKDRRERIIAAAATIFARHGYAVALDAIAAEASVGRTTLYRNFADRYALALAAMERRIEDVAAIAYEHHDRPDTFLLMVRKMCESRTDYAALANAVAIQHGAEGRQAIAVLRARMEGVCSVPIARAQRAGLIRSDFAITEVHRLTMMLAAGATEWDQDDRDREFDRALRLVMEGLQPPTAARKK